MRLSNSLGFQWKHGKGWCSPTSQICFISTSPTLTTYFILWQYQWQNIFKCSIFTVNHPPFSKARMQTAGRLLEKVRELCTKWSIPRQQTWTLWMTCLASLMSWATVSLGRSQNSPLTTTCLICLSLCHLQCKQMTWAAGRTGLSNSELVFLREGIWQIFKCWPCFKCWWIVSKKYKGSSVKLLYSVHVSRSCSQCCEPTVTPDSCASTSSVSCSRARLWLAGSVAHLS